MEARIRAEKMIHSGFVKAHEYWQKRAADDPEWAKENPFRFDVVKENGILIIHNSMDKSGQRKGRDTLNIVRAAVTAV